MDINDNAIYDMREHVRYTVEDFKPTWEEIDRALYNTLWVSETGEQEDGSD